MTLYDRGDQEGETTSCYSEQALWHGLSEMEPETEFCHSWLGLQCKLIGGVFSGLVLLGQSDGSSFAPIVFWPRTLHSAAHLHGVAERVISARKGVVTRNDTTRVEMPPQEQGFHIGYPVKLGEALHGAVLLEISSRPQAELQVAMRQLQWGIAWLQNLVLHRQIEPEALVRHRLASVLDLAAVALQERTFQDAASAFVTLVATRFGCDRVSVGFMHGKQTKVAALSHSAQFGQEMNLIRAIGAAMDESLDQQRVLVYPETGESGTVILHAHGQLALEHGDRAVCTTPFINKSGIAYGALTLERSDDRPFDPETILVCESTAALVGPILEEKRRNDRPLAKKALEVLRLKVEKVVGPDHMAIKLILIGMVLLVLFFSFAKGDYRISANCAIEGTVKRAVVAPFNGFIYDAPVRAGDIVTQGQIICSLDDRDLRLERLKWASQREQRFLESLDAMAKDDAAKAKIAREQMNQADAQLAMLDEQLSRVKIIAPFRGLVVSGDLSQSLFAPVERGQVLFEVAPLDSYRVKLEVNERDINEVRVGQKGDLILNSLPQISFPFSVSKITPVSKPEEGVNYFIVEAELAQQSERLRPGMEGYGKVLADRYKLIWIWTHKLLDWVRVKLWAWLP